MPHTTVLAFDNTSVPTRLNTRPRPLLSQSPTAGPSTFLKPVSLPIRPRTSKNDVTAAPNIRQLRIAFEETPAKLRELEQGWRARRRRVLGDVTEIKQIPAAKSSRQIPSEISEVALSAKETDPIGDQPESPRQVHRPRRRISGSNPATYRVMPPRTQELPSAHRDEVPLGRPGSSHISLRVPVAPPTPPASPPTPPRQPGLSPHSQRIVEPGSPARLNRIHPIMAQPLPPTSHPVPISRSTPRDTIRVLPFGSPIELAISLHSGRRKIVVLQGGLELNLEGEAVRLVEQKAWGRRERKEWEMVQALVERVKRSTPRVKVFHTFGHLTITCSYPADIILSFSYGDMTGPVQPQDRSKLPKPPTKEVKVRVAFSRIVRELRIDIAASTPISSERNQSEKYRTRRIVPLEQVGSSNGDNSDAVAGLGISWSDGWRAEEIEGVKRLWALRDEWERFG